MNCTIVIRNAPDWHQLADTYRRTSRYDATKLLPNPRPPGFPKDLLACIDLWNNTFSVDFFTCRAELSQIARMSWATVQNASLISFDQIPDTISCESDDAYCFTDDDDWFTPNLLNIKQVDGAHALRWPSPVFDGDIVYRPVSSLFPRMSVLPQLIKSSPVMRPARALYRPARALHRRLVAAQMTSKELPPKGLAPKGLPQRPCDVLFQTNNYCFTGKLLKLYGRLDRVIDHVHASNFFMVRPFLRIKAVDSVWSMTNKHPCAATVLYNTLKKTSDPAASLFSKVTEYVHAAKKLRVAEGFEWSIPLIMRTRSLFERCINHS